MSLALIANDIYTGELNDKHLRNYIKVFLGYVVSEAF